MRSLLCADIANNKRFKMENERMISYEQHALGVNMCYNRKCLLKTGQM